MSLLNDLPEDAITVLLYESVLNDDVFVILPPNMKFSHHNSRYAIQYWTYANEWCNNENWIYGKNPETLLKRYEKLVQHEAIECVLGDIEDNIFISDNNYKSAQKVLTE